MSTDSHGYDAEPARSAESSRRSGTASRAGARTQRARRGEAPPRRRRKARRVHRVIRHVDIWSLAKIGGIYVACGYVISMISGFILWRAADIAGTIDGIEGFMEDTGGYDTFEMRGDVVFSSAVMIGAVLSLLAVCLIILAGILFNLISDLTGGIRMTVIDEDLLVTPARRGAPPRRPAPRPAPPVDVVEEDDPDGEYSHGSRADLDDEYDADVHDAPGFGRHEDDVHDDAAAAEDQDDVRPDPGAAPFTSATPSPVVVPSATPRPATSTWDRPEPRISEPAVSEPDLQDAAAPDVPISQPAEDPWPARPAPSPAPAPTPAPVPSPAPVAEPDSAPAPVPAFRTDGAATSSFNDGDDARVDPVDAPVERPPAPSGESIVSDEDQTVDPVAPPRTPEPEPEPTGDVDPAFDRLLAGAGAGDVAAEPDDEPDPEPARSRFEIDFG